MFQRPEGSLWHLAREVLNATSGWKRTDRVSEPLLILFNGEEWSIRCIRDRESERVSYELLRRGEAVYCQQLKANGLPPHLGRLLVEQQEPLKDDDWRD